ncbi:hypothetical protein B0T10DRAFT_410916, partial [Thelonectria olida]
MTTIYWAILRRWQYLQQCSSTLGDDDDRPIENIGGNGNGNDAEASVERVLRIDSSSKELVKIEFEKNWKPGRDWVQVLRPPGNTRAAVQHLALFVPWEKFTRAASGDINEIWEH